MRARGSGTRAAGRATTPVRRGLEQRLLGYAAAGASLLNVQPAHARVIYTPMNETIAHVGLLPLDLNHDGVTDFNIVEWYDYYSSNGGFWSAHRGLKVNGADNPGASVIAVSPGSAAALPWGAVIGSTDRFARVQGVARNMASMRWADAFGSYWSCHGPWETPKQYNCAGVIGRFLGLKFEVGGKTHYGWAGFSNVLVGYDGFNIRAQLVGIAYEDVPGKPIRAGQTSGTADDPMFGGEPGIGSVEPEVSAEPEPISQSVQPATLGLLALGAQGIPFWRRRESITN